MVVVFLNLPCYINLSIVPKQYEYLAPVMGASIILGITRSYLKNGRLRLKPKLGASQWILQMNNGQQWSHSYPSRSDEQMAKADHEWITVPS